MKKRLLNAITVIILCIVLGAITIVTGCSGYLTEEQEESLLEQYVIWDEDDEPYEAEYLPCHTVASWRLFGTEEKGEYTYVYADVLDETYVLFENKAYSQSGAHMPIRMKVKEVDGELKLIDTDYPEDGDDYWESIKKMYPRKYFWQYQKYHRYDYEKYNMLEDQQEKKLKKMWGEDTELERENFMDIEEDGNYRIWTAEDGTAEEFEVIVLKEGKL